MHPNPHPMRGKEVTLKSGSSYIVEDYWDRVAGRSWMVCDGNPACMEYGMRSGSAGLPTDNEVLYGKTEGFGYLIHVSEIA